MLSEVSRLINIVLASKNFIPPVTVGVEELAPILKKQTKSIYSDLVRRPSALPPPLEIVEDGRLLWLYEDVISWLKAHRAPANSFGVLPDDVVDKSKRRSRHAYPPKVARIASDEVKIKEVGK